MSLQVHITQSAPQRMALCSLGVAESWVLATLSPIIWTYLVPTLVRGELQNNTVVQVAAGEHSICVARDGLVYTWGGNNDGQLGVADVGFCAGLPITVLVQALNINSTAATVT